MKSTLLKSLSFVLGLFAITPYANATDITATLVHTAGTRYSSAATVANTVDGAAEYYNNDATTGWVGYAFAEFSFEIPAGENVTSASLTWTASTTSKARDNKLYYLTAGTTLDYEKIASTQEVYKFGDARTYIGNENFKNTATRTTDVTDAVKTVVSGGQTYVIFQWTGNAGSATLAGKGSDQAPVLVLKTTSASSLTKYTVKYVDSEGNVIKEEKVNDCTIGSDYTASDDDLASFFNSDKTKKYIYVSGNETKTADKDQANNVITLQFREAATWNYTFKAVNGDGATLQDVVAKGSNFEGETFNVGYPYAINIDGTLYTAKKLSSDGKGYYVSLNLAEDNLVKEITYSATETTGIVFLSEAENIEGLTKTNNANTAIRSSNGGSAFAAEDTEITKLPAGKYKLTSIICDVSSKPNSWWNYLAGNDTIYKQNVTTVNWSQGTSEEFTLKAETPIIAGKGGSVNAGIDLIYIQKTGDYVPETPSYPEGDVTETYIVNPGFENCEAATGNVGTSGSAQGTDYEAAGWKLATSTAWTNAAAFAYGSDAQLNGVAVPAADNAGNAGKALGFTMAWNGEINYKSAAEVTLPAGSYTLTAHAYNAGTATKFASELGFVTADKTYASEKKDFALNEWVEDKVTFVLDAETTGHFIIGGKAENVGSGAHGKVFFDNITLERKDLLNGARQTLADEIATAKEVAAKGLAPKDALQAAITTAEAAAENTNYKDVLAAADALKAAVGTYNETNTHFVQLADVKAKYTFAADAYPYASAEKAQALATVIAKTPATAEEADAQQTEVINAARAYVESNAKAEGVEGAVDYTASIKNPNAESQDNWNATLSSGAKINILNAESFTDAEGNANYSYFDGGNWGGNSWDVTYAQTVNLPKGKYLLTVTSRASENMSSFALFAGEQRTEMTHVGASGELFNRGWNDANVTFNVTEENADVNLGVQGVTSETRQWMSFTRFRLVRVGDIVETPVSHITVVENIGDLLKLQADEVKGIDVKLKLTDAKVTVLRRMGGIPAFAMLEDATGGVQLSNWVLEVEENHLLDITLRDSVALNGYLYGNYNPGTLFINDSTSASQFTVTPTTIVPKATTVADLKTPDNNMRLVEMKGVSAGVVSGMIYLKQGDASIDASDLLGVFPVDENDQPIVPKKLESIDGILMYYASEGTDPEYYGFVPTAYKEEVINPKDVAKSQLVFLPTEEAVATAKAEGWLKGGDTRVDNKKGNIDPATGEAVDKAVTFPGLGVKKGNSAKSLTIYVKGVDKFVTYATSTSSSKDRAISITAVNVDDESDSSAGAQVVKGNTTTAIEIELFDADATYAITFEGVELGEDGKPDYATGGDVAIHGITFNPDKGGTTGITNVNAASLLNKDVYSTNGTLVRKAGESLKGLSKGLYIIGGKKVVIK